jgi:hypothetical protein
MDVAAAAGKPGFRFCGHGQVSGKLHPLLFSCYGYLTEKYYIIIKNIKSKTHFEGRRSK